MTTEAVRTTYRDEDAALRVLLVSAVAALDGFLFGFDTAVINGAVDAIKDEFLASSLGIGFAVSSALLGSAVGAWFSGGLADRYDILTMLVAIATIDRFGRRPLLLIGSVGMALSLGVLAAIFATAPTSPSGDPELGSLAGPVALVAANLFVVFFGMSWGPVVWVLLGEMFPNRIRAIALSVAAAANCRVDELPAAPGSRARLCLRALHRCRRRLGALRRVLRPGDEGQGARGDVGPAARRGGVRGRES